MNHIQQENQSAIEALKASEKRYRRLFESAQDGILIVDDTGKVDDANPFLLALMGYSHEEICGKHLWELGAFNDITASRAAFKHLQDTHYVRYENLPLRTRKGDLLAVEFVSNVYLVDGKKVIQCNIRDISDRKQLEASLAKSREKMRSILDNINIGVSLISPEMTVLELNRKMCEWFPDVDVGQRPVCYRVFTDPGGMAACPDCPAVKTLQDGRVHEGVREHLRKGKTYTYRMVSSPVHNTAGRVTAIVEMVEDITERITLESRLRQARKLESIGRLAGGVAHEYNNMLSVILGYAELAMDKLAPDDPVCADIREIISASDRSAQITRQLLAFSRNQIIAPRLIDVNRAVTKILKTLTHLIGENVDLVWRPGKELKPVLMDATQIDQILINLCLNARDAISDMGRITIETGPAALDQTFCGDHQGCLPGDYIRLRISDDGCGMDEETRDRLFEPFFTTKDVGLGTGLGLSTVYGIVKQNRGAILVYSRPDEGTAFEIYLPRGKGQTPSRGHPSFDHPCDQSGHTQGVTYGP